MRYTVIAFILFSVFLFFACQEEEVIIKSHESQELTGYWGNQQWTDTLIVYERKDNLVAGQYGFAFLPDGKFLERKNSGWCGTPPIAYADYQGAWALTDSVVTITVGYWGGTATYLWKVVSVDEERLAIEVISQYYSQEN